MSMTSYNKGYNAAFLAVFYVYLVLALYDRNLCMEKCGRKMLLFMCQEKLLICWHITNPFHPRFSDTKYIELMNIRMEQN